MAPHADTVASSGANAAKTTNTSQHQHLRVSGTRIVDESSNHVMLKGTALGGHLNMENFITGYSGHEHEHRAAMAEVLGQEKAAYFFDRFIHYFFRDEDAAFFASLGLNCIRVPFNYRHFIDDSNPTVVKQSGFDLLDNIVDICARHGLYVILDLHSVPGGQNQDWHSDSGVSRALFWDFKVFQDQAIDLWVKLAEHYVGNPVIAGYNPLNEPADPEHTRLIAWYKRAEKAIRTVDPDHILFFDGNTYAMDFSRFESVLPNSVYACHDYAMLGFPIPGQAPYSGTPEQNAKLRRQFDRKAEFTSKHGVPLWNGEWGPVYSDERKDPNGVATNQARLGVLREQLNIYAETQTSWSIWTYKDVGYQGMVYASPDSPYMKLIEPFVAKKQALGLDFWGVVDKSGVADLYEPFVEGLREMVPEHLQNSKYPPTWSFDRQVERVVRECLMSEYLGKEFAELFAGKSFEEIDELAASFKFENCVKRDGLNEALRADAARSLK
jgi:aryl-phospho-beta-D-glucosidase BglC (GH1 family)